MTAPLVINYDGFVHWLAALSDDDRAALELKDRPKPEREV